jgi:hypothetical protein
MKGGAIKTLGTFQVPPKLCCWKDLDEHDLMEFICKDLDSECGRY